MAGGGVGEAMLIGAAIGGGSAAVTGGDPLKGALLGGLTGGAGAGIAPVLGGTSGALPGALTPAATTAAADAAMASALPTTTALTSAAPGITTATSLPVGLDFAQASQAANAANIASGTNAAMANALPLTQNAGIAGLSGATPAPYTSAFAPGSVAPAAGPTSFQAAMQNPLSYIKANPLTMGAAGLAGAVGARRPFEGPNDEYEGPLSRFRFDPSKYRPGYYADGGIASLNKQDMLVGGSPARIPPVESDQNSAFDWQQRSEPVTRMASGGISDLGSYSDGGRMLRGPGDGMSDSIPGVIANKRPARLADGEFVVPADVVSHLGNGSTDAGAKQLYAMMDKVRKARTGTKKQGREINPRKYVPA